MPTAMKKVEIYANDNSCDKVQEILDSYKVYWYMEDVALKGQRGLCKITLYAPVHTVGDIISRLASKLDFRRLDNMIIVSDVEAGMGAPYRITSRRSLLAPPPITSRPWFILKEEAEDKARVTLTQIALAALASLVALAGLAHDNPYIIIGAMLLSPIMAPIYSFSITLISKNRIAMLKALTSLLLLLTTALTASLIATTLTTVTGQTITPTNELLQRAQLTWDALTVPILLGLATIIASASDVAEALIGVAIAAALIPPAATTGWAIATSHPALAANAAINLAANTAGLLLGGITAGLILLKIRKNKL
ncbi:MAG: DUF389 domain-containing protein [Desulfurococcales archaeon]|nr:DUF389 domain-containing protein [Desulfurococcales archaeon]